jgi:hypothetical protein
MNRSSSLCAAVALMVVAAIASVRAARAQDSPATIGGVLCDTQDQLRAIVAANQRSADAGRSVFQMLNMQLNARNQPTCSAQQVQHELLSVPHSIDIGRWPQDNQALEAFALYIQAGGIEGWFMYIGPRDLLGPRGPAI